MGKLLSGRKPWKHSAKNKVHKMTKTVDIILPLELLHYCIQTVCRTTKLHEVKATVLTKHKKKEIVLNICQNEDTINFQLQDANDFPVAIDDDTWQCCIKSFHIPTNHQNHVATDSSEGSAGAVTRRQARNNLSNSQKSGESCKSSFSENNKQDSALSSCEILSPEIRLSEEESCNESLRKLDYAADKLTEPKEETNIVAEENNGVEQNSLVGKSRVKPGQLPCRMCRASFSKISGLKRHVIRKHKLLWAEYEMRHGNVDKILTTRAKPAEISSHAESPIPIKEDGNNVGAVIGTRIRNGLTKLLPCPVCGNVLHHNSYLIPHVQLRHQDYRELFNLEQLIKGDAEVATVYSVSEEAITAYHMNDSESVVCLDCPKCHLSYKDNKSILNHVQLSHQNCPDYGNLLQKVDNMIYQKFKPNADVSVISNCEFCRAERIGRSIFKHLEICHSSDPNYENIHQQTLTHYFQQLRRLRSEKKRAYENKLRTNGQIYSCRFCSKQFKYRPARCNHENFRCRENPRRRRLFECYVCGFSTAKEDVFKLHKEKHASDPKTVNACKECNKQYKTRAGLTIHQRKVHNIFAKQPIVYLSCEECGKKFYDKDHLTKHLVKHSDERPFQCELCGQQYKTAYGVNKHQKMVHYNKYAYHCEKCGHGVEKKKYLTKHICGRTRRVQDQDALPNRKQRKKQKIMACSENVVKSDRLDGLTSDVFTLQMASDGNVMVQELVDAGTGTGAYIPTSYCVQMPNSDLHQNGVIQTVEVLTESQIREKSSQVHGTVKADAAAAVAVAGEYEEDKAVRTSQGDGFSIIHQAALSSNVQQNQLSSSSPATTHVPQHTTNHVIQTLNPSGVISQSFKQLEMGGENSNLPGQLVQYPVGNLKSSNDQSQNEVEVIQIPLEYSQFFNLSSTGNGLNWTAAPNTQPRITLPPITLASVTLNPAQSSNVTASLPVAAMSTDAVRGSPSLSADTGIASLETTGMDTSEQLTSSAISNQVVMSDLLQLLPSALPSVTYSNDR